MADLNDFGLTNSLNLLIEKIGREAREIAREAGDILLRHAREEAPRGLSFRGGEPQAKTGRASGTLRQSLHRSPVEQVGPNAYAVSIEEDERTRVDWEDATVGFLIQAGTAQHRITPRTKDGALAFTTPAGSLNRKRTSEGLRIVPGKPAGRRKATFSKGISKSGRAKQTTNTQFADYTIAKSVTHPGTAANPFMDRAVERALPEIDDLIQRKMSET